MSERWEERLTYKTAGVDIDAGEEAVALISPLVRSTARREVLGSIGGFGGLFALDTERYRAPVLVASTDGVGTKAQVARDAGRLTTIGIDLVAMCVDDLVCQGAEPLFFLDYVATGKLDPAQLHDLVAGMAEGCRQAGCALLGGETAEHPGGLIVGDFDLAGFAVGVVERDRLLDGSSVRPGDVLVGLPSPGLRSNGYSLARSILFERAGLRLDEPAWPGSDRTVADELLEPSVIYAPSVLKVLARCEVHAIAHITGGGIPGNLRRVLPGGCDAVVERQRWEPPRIFAELARLGGVVDPEMVRVFNLGIGMVVVIPAAELARVFTVLADESIRAIAIGEIISGTGRVQMHSGAE